MGELFLEISLEIHRGYVSVGSVGLRKSQRRQYLNFI